MSEEGLCGMLALALLPTDSEIATTSVIVIVRPLGREEGRERERRRGSACVRLKDTFEKQHETDRRKRKRDNYGDILCCRGCRVAGELCGAAERW